MAIEIPASDVPPAPVISDALDEIADRNRMASGIRAMQQRRQMFSSKLEMDLTGVAVVPEARSFLNDRLTGYWEAQDRNPFTNYMSREVIIGDGFAAAVYAASRVRLGFRRPIVLTQNDAAHVGGTFAMAAGPAFRLNSGNRPGNIGLPGNLDASLNYLPGAIIQPASMTSAEYQTNQDMASAIRWTLAQFADVYPGTKVDRVDIGNREIFTETGPSFLAGRVIDARGLGAPANTKLANGSSIQTFDQFMRRMGEETFPLAGLGRVAVVGGGDSGKCAVESLLGIAPSAVMSVTAMDFVRQIDWYGTGLPLTCESWRQTQRGRYQRIGSYLPRETRGALRPDASASTRRLKVIQNTASVTPSFGGVLVNEDTYDTVILCTGNRQTSITGLLAEDMPYLAAGSPLRSAAVSAPRLGRRGDSSNSYVVLGAAADLPFTDREREQGITAVPANKVAMFRYGPRVAAAAATLEAVTG